jgi:FtsZ-binding cell division protein ZapB
MANGELVEKLARMVVAQHKAEMEIVELMKKNGQLGKENFKLEIEGVGMKRQNHALQQEFDAARERVDALNSRNEELEREIQSLRSGANADILENESVDGESSEILGEDHDQSESQEEVTGGENLITQAEPPMPIEDQRVGENPNDAVEPSMILEHGETENNGLERKPIGDGGQNWNLQKVNAYVFKMDRRLKQIMTANPCSPSEKSKKKMTWVKGEIIQAKRYAEKLWWHHLPKRA